MKKLSIFLVKIYKYLISGTLRFLFGPGCRFTPTCSEYAIASIEKFGVVEGSILTIKRLSRCHPGSAGRYDPIPKTA